MPEHPWAPSTAPQAAEALLVRGPVEGLAGEAVLLAYKANLSAPDIAAIEPAAVHHTLIL